MFYTFNGYDLDYGEDLRSMLKLLSVREELIDEEVAVEYLSEQTEPMSFDDLEDGEALALGILSFAKSFSDDYEGWFDSGL